MKRELDSHSWAVLEKESGKDTAWGILYGGKHRMLKGGKAMEKSQPY